MVADDDSADARIKVGHQPYLQYAAAAYLLQKDGDEESLKIADKFMAQFDQMIKG
jgi:hypothetical protein